MFEKFAIKPARCDSLQCMKARLAQATVIGRLIAILHSCTIEMNKCFLFNRVAHEKPIGCVKA